MLHTVLPYLIVCPLTFLAGFVDAVAGGGGLISLPAYMIAGLPVHFAIGTNKLSSGMGTALAAGRLAKGGSIPWRQAGVCVAAALAGAWSGARLALLVSDGVFKRLMLVILPLTALYILRSRPLGDGAGGLPRGRMTRRALLAALVIGVYDGFYGPGTGTFLLLLLTGFAGFRLGRSTGWQRPSTSPPTSPPWRSIWPAARSCCCWAWRRGCAPSPGTTSASPSFSGRGAGR